MKTLFRKISCLVSNRGVVAKKGRRIEEKDLGLIRDAALAYDESKGVLWVGSDKEIPSEFKKWKSTSAKGHVAYPGLVDCHTHMAFAGNRAHEFALRMSGATYQEIASSGGGILYSVRETRNTSLNDLSKLIEKRLGISYDFGVRLVEAKSGYGLSLDSEITSLQAIRKASRTFQKTSAETTCLTAHAIPPEFKNKRSDFIDLLCVSWLVKLKKYARFCDVFCDEGFFTIEETRKILKYAKALDYELRLHGEELAQTGAAELAVELGARSVDHLLKVSEKGIKALAASSTVAVLLPATSFFLKEPPAPARKLLAAGAAVAISTDFNPGTSPTQNLPFVGSLAAIQLGMTPAEVIAAMTYVPALSLGREKDYGALLPGFKCGPIFCEGEHPSSLIYDLARPGLPIL